MFNISKELSRDQDFLNVLTQNLSETLKKKKGYKLQLSVTLRNFSAPLLFKVAARTSSCSGLILESTFY